MWKKQNTFFYFGRKDRKKKIWTRNNNLSLGWLFFFIIFYYFLKMQTQNKAHIAKRMFQQNVFDDGLPRAIFESAMHAIFTASNSRADNMVLNSEQRHGRIGIVSSAISSSLSQSYAERNQNQKQMG